MCGIAGVISFTEELRTQERILGRMQETLRRRGPDQEGMFLSEHAGLVHTRLAVIDPENGRQPMQRHDAANGEYTIVYNGELYNTAELRAELIAEGADLATHSDTEVVLQAYMHWGSGCVKRFNGIFAFAVWEAQAERLFLARDRIGVKPLFYHLDGERLVFGSELKAILAHPGVPHEVGIEGVSQLLLFGPGRTPGCGVFAGMREILPGECAYFTRGGLRKERYWQLAAKEHTENFGQTAEHVRYLLTDAIRRQLVSDVPIGTFLSGGLDSSLISSVAAREFAKAGRQLHTFSVDYRDNDKYFKASKFQPNSDPAYIRQMEQYLGAVHHWTVIDTPALAEALFAATEARDLPGMADVDASLLLFCGEIREQVTVALSGECADELFGGYPWYRDPDIRAAYGFPWSQSTAYRMQFARPEIAALLEKRSDVDREYRATLARTAHLPDEDGVTHRMREMMRLNFDWFMQTLLEGSVIKANRTTARRQYFAIAA